MNKQASTTIQQALDFSSINRVLVTKLRYHGDVLLSSPVFQALKNHHPHLEIDALIYKETRDMLSLHPAVTHIFTVDKNKEQGFWQQLNNEKRLLSQLHARHYDMIIHLTEHWRGFYLKHLLNIPYAVTAQYPRRENNHFWQCSFSHIYPVPIARNKAASHMDALRFLGIKISEQEEKTSLTISHDDQEEAQRLLRTHNLTNKGYIHIHPTSRFFYKCWPPQTMADFINRLTEQDHKVLITAAPNQEENHYIHLMMNAITTPVVNLAGGNYT